MLENQYGILVVEPDSETNTPDPDNAHLFCLVYYPSVNNISAKANATKHPLTKVLDLGDADTCEDGEDLNQVEANFAYINGSSKISNCSVAERAARLERYKAVGMISDRIITGEYNSSQYNISIEVLTLVERDAKERLLQYKTSYPEGVFYIYENGSDEKGFDLSLVVILVMAVMTVTLGSFWSGHAKHNLRLKMQREAGAERLGAEDPDMIQPQDGSGAAEEELSIHVSPLLVLFFVLCMCSMLVLLYFFFNQLGGLLMLLFILILIWKFFSVCDHDHVLYRELPGDVQLPRAPGDGQLQPRLAARPPAAAMQPLPLRPPARAQTVPPPLSLYCHLRHMVRVQEDRLVLDTAGHPRHHVQYKHAQSSPSSQSQDLHYPPECSLLL